MELALLILSALSLYANLGETIVDTQMYKLYRSSHRRTIFFECLIFQDYMVEKVQMTIPDVLCSVANS